MSGNTERTIPSLDIRLPSGDAQDSFWAWAERALDERWAERLFERDASLWGAGGRGGGEDDGEGGPTAAGSPERALGWLDLPGVFRERVAALEGFGEAIRDAGFTTAVVCGMGANARVARAFAGAFGSIPDWLAIRALDSTHPAAVDAAFEGLEDLTTLVVVSSKSGATPETLVLEAEAWSRLEAALKGRHAPGIESPGDLMVAVTDPDSGLRAIPHHDRLHEVFLDRPDVSGAYAALGYVGLVPASLLGVDLDPLLDSAVLMLERCRAAQVAENPGLALGLALGSLARIGRDKLTVLADPELAGFASWLEQLLAESTGKQGAGIVPIVGESPGDVTSYGDDRVFVRLSLAGAGAPSGEPLDELPDRLASAGHPVLRIATADPIDLGAEFVRWEVATAFAAAVLGVDPFDRRDAEATKERTRGLLDRLRNRPDSGGRSAGPPYGDAAGAKAELLASDHRLMVLGDRDLAAGRTEPAVEEVLAWHLARLAPHGYVAFLAFLARTPERDRRLASIRTLLRDATRRATVASYGPGYFHGARRLRGTGAPDGVFLLLTADHAAKTNDRQVAGRSYTFGDLVDAQASAEFAALQALGLPIVRVHLAGDTDEGLKSLEAALAVALLAERSAGGAGTRAPGSTPGDVRPQDDVPAPTDVPAPVAQPTGEPAAGGDPSERTD